MSKCGRSKCGVNGCNRPGGPNGEPCWQHSRMRARPAEVVSARGPHTVCDRGGDRVCDGCQATRMEDGRRAVIVTSTGRHVAYVRCRVCGYAWPVPVQR